MAKNRLHKIAVNCKFTVTIALACMALRSPCIDGNIFYYFVKIIIYSILLWELCNKSFTVVTYSPSIISF
jgi:hypothetical protein